MCNLSCWPSTIISVIKESQNPRLPGCRTGGSWYCGGHVSGPTGPISAIRTPTRPWRTVVAICPFTWQTGTRPPPVSHFCIATITSVGRPTSARRSSTTPGVSGSTCWVYTSTCVSSRGSWCPHRSQPLQSSSTCRDLETGRGTHSGPSPRGFSGCTLSLGPSQRPCVVCESHGLREGEETGGMGHRDVDPDPDWDPWTLTDGPSVLLTYSRSYDVELDLYSKGFPSRVLKRLVVLICLKILISTLWVYRWIQIR